MFRGLRELGLRGLGRVVRPLSSLGPSNILQKGLIVCFLLLYNGGVILGLYWGYIGIMEN